MNDQKPSLLKDLTDVRDAVNGLGRAVNKFFSNGTSQVIGPAATQALAASKKGAAAGFRAAKDRIFGGTAPASVPDEPIEQIPDTTDVVPQDV